jgi:endonuclease III
MADHYFSTREELHSFWKRGRGYLLNNFKNCLHETGCQTYRSNPPGLTYTRQGFVTPADVLRALGSEGHGWYSCPLCNPHISINAASVPAISTRVEELTAPPSTASVTRRARPSGEVTGATAEELIEAICEFGRSVPRFTTGLAAADELVYSDGFAFLLACCLDRGSRSETIWKIPYYLKMELGHLNPVQFAQMSIEEIQQALGRLPVRLRYTHDAPYTVLQLAQIISSEFGGRSEALWEGRSPREILRTLRRIRGVDTIANMAVNLLHRYLGIKFSFDELRDIDVKPDVHVERVFQRTGLMDRAGRSVQVARRLKEAYPADLDLGSWEIGRRWCHAISPDHEQCPLSAICPRRDAS